ncbi:MAG: hypothetical protein ABI572_08555 [Actinomycetota bacterium]
MGANDTLDETPSATHSEAVAEQEAVAGRRLRRPSGTPPALALVEISLQLLTVVIERTRPYGVTAIVSVGDR